MKLYNTKCEDALKEIPDASVELILTDPPYKVANKGRHLNSFKSRNGKFKQNFATEDWDYGELILPWEEFRRVLTPTGGVVVFTAFKQLGKMEEDAKPLLYKTTGVWHKTNPMPLNYKTQFVSSLEAWVYFSKIRTRTFNGDGVQHNLFECSTATSREKTFGKHPTQKPVRLMEEFVRLLTNEGDVILDPYMGSGSTGVACKNLGREFIGIEMDERYFKIAQGRLNEKI